MSSKRAQEEKQLYNSVKTLFENIVNPNKLEETLTGGMPREKFIKCYRYTNKEIKSRIPAIIQICKLAKNKFQELYSGEIDLNMAIALFCSGMQFSGDHIVQMASLGVAFGIWVADVLTEADKIDDLNDILPEEYDFSSKMFFDVQHSNEIIERIAYVCENIETDGSNVDILNKIIALIPQEYIERGVEHYEKLSWDILEIVLKEFNDLSIQKENLISMLSDSLDITKLSNMSMYALGSEYNEKMSIATQLDSLDVTIATIFSPLHHYYFTDNTMMINVSPNAQKIYNRVNELIIENPYELCGIFWVLKQRDDYRYWAMGPFATAVSFAAKRLPWTCELEYEEPQTDTNSVNADMYSLKYKSAMFDSAKDPNALLNLSQLIYHLSGGGILPRHLNSFNSERLILEKNGVPKDTVDFITTTAATLSQLDYRNEYYGSAPDFDDDEEQEGEQPQIENSDDKVNQLLTLLNDIKDKVKKVSADNRLIEEQRKKLQKEFDELKQQYIQEHRELVDLRNYVFNQNDDLQEEMSTADLKIDYPYTVKHNVVVFGGHETWSKAIKPLFANVRFINKDSLPNQDMIKNADIVWIQANSIGHSKYYKILDVVRTYHIPLRYFSYASAEKCAEQIVIEDMK